MGADNHHGDVTVSNSVDEMLDSLSEFESKEYNRRDVEEYLPKRAELDPDGTLVVEDITNQDSEIVTLTETRRNVIKRARGDGEFTCEEIADAVGCSDTTVSRTIRNFKFLLGDGRLHEAFIKRGLTKETNNMYTIKCEHEDCTGLFRRVENEDRARERAEDHLSTWGHFPVIEDDSGSLVTMYNVESAINKEEEELIEGIEMVEEEFGSLEEFFACVAKQGIPTVDAEGVEDEDVDLGCLSDDEAFSVFEIVVDSQNASEELEKKIAKLI